MADTLLFLLPAGVGWMNKCLLVCSKVIYVAQRQKMPTLRNAGRIAVMGDSASRVPAEECLKPGDVVRERFHNQNADGATGPYKLYLSDLSWLV
jgi:hypothetical protein